MTFRHKYRQTITHTALAGTVTNYKFNANGMFDPDNTGAGHQPYYFDQLSGIYDHYTVTWSKITIRACPTTDAYLPMQIALSTNDDTTQTNNTLYGQAEQNEGSWALIPTSSANGNVTRLSCTWNAKTYFGGDPLSNDNLQGTSAANPVETTIYSIGLQSCDGVVNANVFIQVEIDYIAIWDELKDVASS